MFYIIQLAKLQRYAVIRTYKMFLNVSLKEFWNKDGNVHNSDNIFSKTGTIFKVGIVVDLLIKYDVARI